MKALIQRVKQASVTIDNELYSKIGHGILVFLGVEKSDTKENADRLAQKVVNLRIFEDENEKMNLSINDINGSILSVSQFTLYAKLEGRRPSFTDAMKYSEALVLYNKFNDDLRNLGINVKTGEFGADMKVSLVNDGPVTIIIDSEDI